MPEDFRVSTSGTMTAVGHAVALAASRRPEPTVGYAQISGPAGAAVVFEASEDNSTWHPVLAEKILPDAVGIDQGTVTLLTTAKQLWRFRALYGRSLRVRCADAGSGTVTVDLYFVMSGPSVLLANQGVEPGSRFLPTSLGGNDGAPTGRPQVALQ